MLALALVLTLLSPGYLCTEEDPDFLAFFGSPSIAICHKRVGRISRETVFAKYGIDDREQRFYRVEHVIPIPSGGSNDERNLYLRRCEHACY